MNLRPYQQQSIDGLRAVFAKGKKSAVLCVPTGGGKTMVFTTLVKSVIQKGLKAMIICDRKELIGQAEFNLNRLGLFPTIIAPGYKQTLNNVYLASVDTLRRREIPAVNVVIVDEAHKQSFDNTIKRIREEQPNTLIIGATATPLRTGKQTALDEIYEDIVEPITIKELLEQGYLVPCKTYAAKMDLSKIKMRGGDYATDALYNEFNKSQLYDGMIENYEKFAKGTKTIVFNVNVQHSKNTVEKFREAGYIAEHVDGATPKAKRKQILDDFSSGKIQILSNCSVLTTGYDEPSIQTVIVNRATKSLPLWLQMTGRGSRLFEGKKFFTILDMGGNCYTHGLWNDEREWYLQKKRKKTEGVAPVKLCPSCEAMNHASARVCSECAEPFPIKEKKLQKADFVEVKGKRGGSEGINLKKMSRKELHAYAKKMGYSSGWVYHQSKNR
ncbi:putative helicase [uncultured Mediterranean phage uvMED]|nr:putative helicase [uncultured Mediterranean phage uvMED]